MARLHVATLRTEQPQGPYRVAGFCIGGIVAFEMARQLVAAGQRVERLVIVDSAAINRSFRRLRPFLRFVRGADHNARLTRQAVLLSRLRHYELRLRKARRLSLLGQINWASANIARRLRRIAADRPNGAVAPGSLAHDARTQEFASALRTQVAPGPGAGVLLMQDRAASAYIPSPFAGTIDLIWADERPAGIRIDPTRGWAKFAQQVRVHEIQTTHMGLVTNDLPLLAEALRSVMDRSEE
jgi:thioesterase domain-containing protein